MKVLFRERDLTRIERCRTVLEEAGIKTFLKNEHVSNTEAWIPEFDPALCIVDDAEYDKAVELMKQHMANGDPAPTPDVSCDKCGEKNPSNFAVCWNCGEPLAD